MYHRRKTIPILFTLLIAAPLAAAPEPIAGDQFFEEKIRPIFAENCYACHTASKLGGLRVDSRELLLEGGKRGPAIVPGEPEKSLLIEAVQHTDDDLKMPMGDKLPDEQIAALTEWVEMGAPWPKTDAVVIEKEDGFTITPQQRNFWSFRPLQKTAPPQLKDKRAVNYIDNYIFAKLQAEDLEPNEPADKRTLIRRVSLDLTGLPPTPEEVEEFVNDDSDDAYEKLIDRLLASERYGERWGRHWLDVVRFGEDDTRGLAKGRQGHEKYPMAYLYRDWVIKAFNEDMPYDQFIKRQLAADLLGKTDWEKKPTADYGEEDKWGRLKIPNWDEMTEEERRELIPYGHIVDESLDTEHLPALGLLGGGPWYYDLGDAWQMRADERNDRVDVVTRGFLGVTVACARCHDHKYDPISSKDYYSLAGVFFNSPYHEYPLVEQPIIDHWKAKNERVEAQKKRIEEFLEAEAEQLAQMYAHRAKDYMVAAWRVTGEPEEDIVEVAYKAKLDVEALRRWIDFLAKPPTFYPYLVEWQSMIRHGGSLDAATNMGDIFQETLLRITREYEENDERNEKIRVKAWPLDDKPPIPMPNEFKTSFEKYHIEVKPMKRVRVNLYRDVYQRDLNEDDDDRRKPGLLRFKDWGLESRLTASAQQHLERMREELKRLEKERGEQYPFVMGVRDNDIITELPFHKRGSPTNLGEPVKRRFIEVLQPEGEVEYFTKGSGRLELAEAIAEHPLSARVIVNRVWNWHFGQGIVDTPSNFGQVGDRPSHPGLLEHLAQRFVDSGRSIKKLHKDILLSHTYRQSSAPNETAAKQDPENELYWRFDRQRLDAEQIRDSLLYVSGLLEEDERGGESGDIDSPEFKRRAVYGNVSRFRQSDFHATFDFPNPNLSASKRFTTSVPLQRLFFMNSDFVYETAAAFAERVQTAEKPEGEEEAEEPEKLSDEEAIEKAYRLLYGRAPSEAEITAGLEFLEDPENKPAEDDYREEPVTPWNLYARALLSSNEFLFLN